MCNILQGKAHPLLPHLRFELSNVRCFRLPLRYPFHHSLLCEKTQVNNAVCGVCGEITLSFLFSFLSALLCLPLLPSHQRIQNELNAILTLFPLLSNNQPVEGGTLQH